MSALACAGNDQLDQLHLRDGVEHVQPEEAIGPPAGVGESLYRQRRGRGREDRVCADDRVEFRVQPRLDVVVLDDGLDDVARRRELLRVGDDLDVMEPTRPVDFGAELAEGLLDGRARALGGAVRAGEQQHRPVVGGGGCEAAGDGAAAGDGEAFAQGSPFGLIEAGPRPG